MEKQRVVFNSNENEYRLQIVYVKFIGTHTEYGAVDADTVEPD